MRVRPGVTHQLTSLGKASCGAPGPAAAKQGELRFALLIQVIGPVQMLSLSPIHPKAEIPTPNYRTHCELSLPDPAPAPTVSGGTPV